MDADHLSNAVSNGINLQQILWMPNVTLLAMRKLQNRLNPDIYFVKILTHATVHSSLQLPKLLTLTLDSAKQQHIIALHYYIGWTTFVATKYWPIISPSEYSMFPF